MIGPGLNGSPDFVQRQDSVGGRPQAGLFPGNYWTPGQKESRQARARRLARQIPKASVQYLLDQLDRRLRNVVGLNVRQPSHSVAPFRATQWSRTDTGSIAGAATRSANIGFDNSATATPVPEGVRGVMAVVKAWVFPDNLGSLFNNAVARLTILKNNVIVPGMRNLGVGSTTVEVITDAAGSDNYGATITPAEILVPIKLEPGDTLSYTLIASSVNADFHFQAAGYFYPIEVEADGILGTMADRGSGAGAGGGLRDW